VPSHTRPHQCARRALPEGTRGGRDRAVSPRPLTGR
jgi:hypothetical protein